MDLEFESTWRQTVKKISRHFDEDLDLKSILFLIGVQETGGQKESYNKNQKLDLMHVAVCRLLEPFGYYTFTGNDAEGWPHFERNKMLPNLNTPDQERLLKQAVIQYFESMDIRNTPSPSEN